MSPAVLEELELAGWRRAVGELYAEVRSARRPEEAHERWRSGRDRLFREHPQSPLRPDDPLRRSGLPYWPYDPGLRFRLDVQPAAAATQLEVATGDGEVTVMRLAGRVRLPEPLPGAELGLWWLCQYGGGLFLPLRDGTAGGATYGGGRYLLDTAKGADLGGEAATLVVDLNFLYHPSCRYDPRWACPLAPEANRIEQQVEAGERL